MRGEHTGSRLTRKCPGNDGTQREKPVPRFALMVKKQNRRGWRNDLTTLTTELPRPFRREPLRAARPAQWTGPRLRPLCSLLHVLEGLGPRSADCRRARRVSIAVLRFDYTGLGSARASSRRPTARRTWWTSLLQPTTCASLRGAFVLIGHSLGGAAGLSASKQIIETRAVVTIGAPADASHVLKLVSSSDLSKIEGDVAADVRIGQRMFKINRQFWL
ncbi:hypothetical protein SAMN05216338_104717 [Bradyrhizobium sp. Rc2d]|nr:hypothetical protein SAMN05216338_104717 [Bradyrhizobium sp. Rc2d]